MEKKLVQCVNGVPAPVLTFVEPCLQGSLPGSRGTESVNHVLPVCITLLQMSHVHTQSTMHIALSTALPQLPRTRSARHPPLLAANGTSAVGAAAAAAPSRPPALASCSPTSSLATNNSLSQLSYHLRSPPSQHQA